MRDQVSDDKGLTNRVPNDRPPLHLLNSDHRINQNPAQHTYKTYRGGNSVSHPLRQRINSTPLYLMRLMLSPRAERREKEGAGEMRAMGWKMRGMSGERGRQS
jgi:hypothetical protein